MNESEKNNNIELIKRLKYRYQRSLDTHDWAAFGACFTEDATSSYSDGALSFKGRDAIVEGISTPMDSPFKISIHQVHHPEIDIISETKATGTWYLHDHVVCEGEGYILTGGAFYHDEYTKIDDSWFIQHIGYERTFEYRMPIPEGYEVTELADNLRKIRQL